MATILVTAATSQLGQIAVNRLLTEVDPSAVAVAVRSPSKVPSSWSGVDVRVIDYSDPSSKWAEVMHDIQRVLLISSGANGEERVQQHHNILDGAKQAGVQFIAYTSILYGDKSTLPLAPDHVKTEAAIKASGLKHAFLRNGWYTENYLGNKAGWMHGKQLSSAGNARFSTAARQDYGEAAAVVVAPSYSGDSILELAGDDSFTYSDLAEFASQKLGKPVAVDEIEPGTYEKILVGMGLPPHLAKAFPLVDVEANKGALYNDSKTLSKLLGRPTTAWRDTVAAAL